MIKVNIPGFKEIEIKNLVLDFNGTLAIDGILISGVNKILKQLASKINIYIITADTFGTVKYQISDINCKLHIFSEENQAEEKLDFIKNLGEKNVAAIGNGRNDSLMLKNAAIGIAVIQKEGCALESLMSADIIVNDIFEAFNLLLNTKRLVATLRA